MFGSKEIVIRSGKKLIVRPMKKEDEKRLFDFFSRLPDDLLMFIRHNVRDPQVIKEWVDHLNYDRVLPIIALDDDRIVADVTLHRIPYGWKRHIGQVRIVVDPAYHGLGLATAILNEVVELGAEFGLEKLWAEVPLDSVAAVKAFKNAGFRCKAVVEGLVKDLKGNNVDILIMVCDIEQYYDTKWLKKSTAYQQQPVT